MKELNVGIVACASMQEQVKECLASLESSFRIYPIVPSCTFSVNIDLFRHYLNRSTSENDVTLLAYGICHPQILTLLAEYGDRVVKVEGSNCFEMFLGSEKYTEYHRKCYWMLNKPFFIRWKDEILTGFGAGTSNGRTLIGDAFKKLVYLRFENDELSIDVVEDFARAVGLEYEIQSVDTANFKRLLKEALTAAYPTARVKVPKPSVSYPHQSEMRTLVESIGEVIYKVDVNTKQFTFVSPQVKTILGYTPSELLGIVNDHPRTPFYHEDDRQKVVAGRYKFLVKCLSEGMQKPYEAEYRVRHKNGDIIWVKECIYPSYSSDGVIESFVGKIADITEPKRVEQALRESEERFRALTESTSDWIWEVNVDGVYTYASPKVKDLLGYEPEEVIGKTPFDLMSPEEAKRIAEEFRAIVESQRTFARLENINLHKDGRLVVLETSGVPFFNFDGQLCGYRGIDRDITERKRAEEALRQAHRELERRVEERTAELAKANKALRIEITERKQMEEELRIAEQNFHNSLDSSPLGVRIITADGELLYANQAILDIYGYSCIEELRTTPVKQRYTPESYAEFKERREKIKRGEPIPFNYELNIIRKDGQVRHLSVFRREVIWGGKKQFLALYQDITEQKRAEEALRNSEERFRNIYEESPIGIELYDTNGRLLTANKACLDIFGVADVAEVTGFKLFDDPNVTDEVKQRLRKGEAGRYEAPFDFEKVKEQKLYRTSKSGVIYLDTLIITLSGTEDKPQGGYLVQVQDITERKQMEEELRIAEQNFRNSLDSSPLGVRIITADGELLYANQTILDICGYSSVEELKAIPAKQRYTPESYAEHQERKEKRKLGKPVPSNYEISIVRKDGEIRRLVVFRKAVVWGGEVQFQALYQDITERKRVEEALRDSEEKLRLMFESVSDGISVTDLDLNFIEVNKTLVRIHGCESKEDLIGRSTFEFIAEKDHATTMAIRKSILEHNQIAIAEGTLLRKDGSEFLGELSIALMTDASGNPIGFIGITRDITERKQVEIALRQSEEFNSSLFVNSPNPILVLNADASIRYVNPALEKLTGFTRAELVGKKPPYPWWSEETYEECSNNLAIAMRRRRGKCEQLFGTKNGQQFWVEVTFKTVELNGEFKYYLANWVDLTERKRLRENMEFYISQITRAQEEERKRIAREIHDEWVQSLAVLALHIDAMAANTGELPEDIIERIRGLRTETDTILEGLRRFSHQLRPGVIDQVGLVPALEILNEELNKEAGVNTRLEVTGPERRLTAEIELGLFRIAQEALRNVRRHSEATEAVIRLKFTRRKVKLAVSDNGRGFELPEMLGDLATEGKLGLIGMQERARLLDGKLAVKSRVGRGTRIVIEVET